MTLQDLKDKGLKYNIRHFRLVDGKLTKKFKGTRLLPNGLIRQNKWSAAILPTGGMSIMSVLYGDTFIHADALCSEFDQFNHKKAVKQLLGIIECQLEKKEFEKKNLNAKEGTLMNK